ncbi:MAG: HypC/HybG/HupF family hydrogenase formation chaperone [Acidimicrobiales bacterium]
MCLGIPGQLVALVDDNEHLAKVDVAGVRRVINIGLLEDEGLAIGDWVLIHVGFAMTKIDEEEAARAMEGLRLMGQAYVDEVDALRRSQMDDSWRQRPTRTRATSGGA